MAKHRICGMPFSVTHSDDRTSEMVLCGHKVKLTERERGRMILELMRDEEEWEHSVDILMGGDEDGG